MTAPPVVCVCGKTFTPGNPDDRRRHQMLYDHTPTQKPRKE